MAKDKKVLFSSKDDDYETPDALFDRLHREFVFTLDGAASKKNAKLSRYITKEQDSLIEPWSGETVFLNPPFSKGDEFARKGYHEFAQYQTTSVHLVAARVDTVRWHLYYQYACEIRFIKGRIKFVGAEHGAGFPSAIVIFYGRCPTAIHMQHPVVSFIELSKAERGFE